MSTDSDRLDWLERQAKDSYAGVTVKGWSGNAGNAYRLIKFHKIFPEKPTLREAIDAAMAEIKWVPK
jgi:hypothetical protein